jgi:hypothetical protein
MFNTQCSIFKRPIKKKGLPFGKPFTNIITQNHRLTVWGKYDGDVCVLFVSLRGKNKRLYQESKIKFD